MLGWLATLPYASDSAVLVEAATETAQINTLGAGLIGDVATVSEAATETAQLTVTESGALTESLSAAAAIAAAESILLAESAAKSEAVISTVNLSITAGPYDVGDLVRLSVAFGSDPNGVTVTLRQPDRTTVTYRYGTDAALVRDSSANYHLDFSLTQQGYWGYRAEAVGGIVAAAEGELYVRNSLVGA